MSREIIRIRYGVTDLGASRRSVRSPLRQSFSFLSRKPLFAG